MDKRIRLGLIFSYSEKWIAGSYYILNLISALDLLEDRLKPHLVILSITTDDFESVRQIQYPYIEFQHINKEKTKIHYPFLYRIVNKLYRVFGSKKKIFKKPELDITTLGLDALFPAVNEPFFYPQKNKLFWIPDFQEHFLPQFFSDKEIALRKYQQQQLVDLKAPIVFSSENAQEHFYKIYQKAKNNTYVLQFAVSHPDYSNLLEADVLKEYSIKKPYFFCSNQFWAHKNHIIILKALKVLKDKNKEVLVIFSGKQEDYRNPAFFDEILSYVRKHNLTEQVLFLGFISRKDQLLLMKNSIAVIQPSLFEGWSTVVEDVKAMSKYIVLSELKVHKEQLKENVEFFNPKDENQLATILEKYSINKPVETNMDYRLNQLHFSNTFMQIVNSLQ